jgi:hypothetical protein
MTMVITGTHCEADCIEMCGDMGIATCMFTQSVSDDNLPAQLARRRGQGPVVHLQAGTRRRLETRNKHSSGHGMLAITCATAAVSLRAYGTCRNSLGPCAFDCGPSTPQTIIWDFGNPWLSMFIRGIVPPWPM